MSWIKCSERLPDEGQKVLLFYPKIWNGIVIGELEEQLGDMICWELERGYVYDNEITHWQPLPEPPKEEA